MTRYVQHVSGQGRMWRVESDTDYWWKVFVDGTPAFIATLPRSDYRLVEPPERWVDVTATCHPENLSLAHDLRWNHRLRKVMTYTGSNEWCFKVEKKQ